MNETTEKYIKEVEKRLNGSPYFEIVDGELYEKCGSSNGNKNTRKIAEGCIYLDKVYINTEDISQYEIIVFDKASGTITPMTVTAETFKNVETYLYIPNEYNRSKSGKVFDSIKYQRRFVPITKVIERTGYHIYRDKLYFCLPGGCMDKTGAFSEELTCRLPFAPEAEKHYGFIDTPINRDDLITIWKTIPTYKSIPLLCMSTIGALTYFNDIIKPHFMMCLKGETQSGKSTLASYALNFYGDVRYDELRGATIDTHLAQEAYKSGFKDIATVIDDYHPEESKEKRAESSVGFGRNARTQGNQTNRNRLQSDGTLGKVYESGGYVITTAEYNPTNVESTVNRVLYVGFKRDMDINDYLTIDGLRGQLRSLYRGWILYLMNYDPVKLKSEINYYYNHYLQKVLEEKGRNKLANHIADFMTDIHFFIRFLEDIKVITTEDEKKGLATEAKRVLYALYDFNAETIYNTNPGVLAFKALKDNYNSNLGYHVLDGDSPDTIIENYYKIDGGIKYSGFKKDGYIYIISGDAKKIIDREYTHLKSININDLADEMGTKGFLEASEKGKYCYQKKFSDINGGKPGHRFIVIPEKLFETED